MSFQALLIHPVTVVTPGTTGSTDRYNNLVPSETSVSERWRIQPAGGEVTGGAEEEIVDRDTRITRFKCFAPPSSTVTGLSRVLWGTRTLRVKGEPRPFYGRKTLHHYEVNLEEVLG